MAIRKTVPKRL